MKESCVIIGAGNLGCHLARALKGNGFIIDQVYSRTKDSAMGLANEVGSGYTTNPSEISNTSSIYFIVLKDDAMEGVLANTNLGNKLLVHCSGSMPLSVLEKYSKNAGVLYPLQTFSKSRYLDFKKVPLFIEANSEKNLKVISGIGKRLSNNVSGASSEKRKVLHLAAVFACNFVNHLYSLSGMVLEKEGLPFEALIPLIEETSMKIKGLSPKEAQTGPAVRYDENIIAKHLSILKEEPGLEQLYYSLSKSIFKLHQK